MEQLLIQRDQVQIPSDYTDLTPLLRSTNYSKISLLISAVPCSGKLSFLSQNGYLSWRPLFYHFSVKNPHCVLPPN